MDQHYRIAFHIGDFGFEIESTDQRWVETKEKQYLAKLGSQQTDSTARVQVHRGDKPDSVSPGLTINEFYKRYVSANDVGSRPNIAVFFIYYLTRIQKLETVKTADVTACFAKIGHPNYNKINMTENLTKAKRKALLNYVNNSWSLTTTGEDYVANTIASTKK